MKPSLDKFSRRLAWSEVDPDWVRRLVDFARREDLEGGGLRQVPGRHGDATTESIVEAGEGCARLVARQPLVVAGLPILSLILDEYLYGHQVVSVEIQAEEGAAVDTGTVLAELRGPNGPIITAERVMLNFLQRLCGVASETARYVAALDGSPVRLLDTRKTTPGYRVLEKYAVACGGGWNHRMGLFDRIMLKDNHLAASKAAAGERLAAAVRRAHEQRPDLGVEVEVDAMEQIPPVLDARADVILLDNFDNNLLAEAIALIGGQALTEASGGISIERLPSMTSLGLDFISTGATVHQARWVDIGLDWQ